MLSFPSLYQYTLSYNEDQYNEYIFLYISEHDDQEHIELLLPKYSHQIFLLLVMIMYLLLLTMIPKNIIL